MKRVLCLGLLLSVCGAVNSTFAQRKMPTGEEIAKSAKSAKLNSQASITSEKDGMKVTVTPMDLSKIKAPKDLEKGQVIAVVDVKGFLDLPNGKYNVFVVKSNDGWQAFFESGGKIVEQLKRVEVSSVTSAERKGVQADIQQTNCFCMSICNNGPSPRVCLMLCRRCL
jgi:hypothetical protein